MTVTVSKKTFTGVSVRKAAADDWAVWGLRPRPSMQAPKSSIRVWIIRIVLLLVVFSGVALVCGTPMLLRGASLKSLLPEFFNFWLWALLTPFAILFDERLPFSDKQMSRRMAAHALFGIFLTVFYVVVASTAAYYIGFNDWNLWTRPLNVFEWLVWDWTVYAWILGALLARRYYKRYLRGELRMERLERQFMQARMNALRMQLDPHFLFNALNTISSQVGRDPKLARAMLEHLGDLLRLSLESKDRQEVPLSEELAFMDHYLAIQKLRFGDRLNVEMRIAPEVKFASVPSLFLQPLAENAIRHGLSGRMAAGSLEIEAQRSGNFVEIRVLDDGVGLPPGWQFDKCSGLGLSVTRERIAGLYPDGRLVVRPRRGGGTEVVVSLPLRLTEEVTDERTAALA